MKEVKRDSYIDILKAFAIILVIIGHSIQWGQGSVVINNMSYFDNHLFKFIYSFHMPLFMLISGYLFYNSCNKKAFFSNITQKIKTILIPILIWSLYPFIEELIKTKDFSIIYIVRTYFYSTIYNLWFLWAVLYCSIIVLIVNKIFKDNIFVYFMIFVLSMFIPNIYNLPLYNYMYPFFVIGYFAKKHDFKVNKYLNLNSFIYLTISYIALLYFYNNSYIYLNFYSVLDKNFQYQFGCNLYLVIIGLLGSFISILILKGFYNLLLKYNKEKIIKVLSYIGRHSLAIYIISSIFFQYYLPNLTYFIVQINYFYVIIESIVVILISLFIEFLISRIPILNRLLFGGR